MDPAWQVRASAQQALLEDLVKQFHDITDDWEDAKEVIQYGYDFLITLLYVMRNGQVAEPPTSRTMITVAVFMDQIAAFARVESEKWYLMAKLTEKLLASITFDVFAGYQRDGVHNTEATFGVVRSSDEVPLDFYGRNDGKV